MNITPPREAPSIAPRDPSDRTLSVPVGVVLGTVEVPNLLELTLVPATAAACNVVTGKHASDDVAPTPVV
jgi:hypothetical protein